MYARATTSVVPPEQQDAAVEQYQNTVPALRNIPGNQGALLLVDRQSGRGIAVSLWEDQRSLEESREEANQQRQQVADRAGMEIESVDEYEVAIWEPAAG